MAPQPKHRRGRHRSSTRVTTLKHVTYALRQPLSSPGPTVAKVSAVTAAAALVVTLALPDDQAQPIATAASGAAAGMAVTGLDQRSGEQVSRATRSTTSPVRALEAPAPAVPQAPQEFGTMSFAAVEKPPPPPEAPDGSSGDAAASSASAASVRSAGSGYDWAAARACSCARGLTKNSMAVLAAVKHSFPNMTNIGGVRPDSLPDHPSGRALDFMTSNKAYGDSIANMLISRAGELNVKYIIWRQRIWQPGRGWKMMSNRGSATANHYDHVHVSVH